MADDKKNKEQEDKEKRQLQDDLDWAESVMNAPQGKYKLKDTDPLQKVQPKSDQPQKPGPPKKK